MYIVYFSDPPLMEYIRQIVFDGVDDQLVNNFTVVKYPERYEEEPPIIEETGQMSTSKSGTGEKVKGEFVQVVYPLYQNVLPLKL